jgi:hypothetical protein
MASGEAKYSRKLGSLRLFVSSMAVVDQVALGAEYPKSKLDHFRRYLLDSDYRIRTPPVVVEVQLPLGT